MKYIQFIGTQRSGSNLLRVMLNQISEISAPHPPHILKTFFPLLQYYGDLNMKENFRSLVMDICDWVNKNPVPWEDLILDTDKIITLCTKPTLLEIFTRIYEEKAIHDNAKYWCCKSMESIYHVKEIEESGLRPFYIYIYRDGRDVALSFKKAIVGPKHIYSLAGKWKEEQRLSLDFLASLEDERFIVIRYEELIASPKSVIQKICKKLHIPFTEDTLDYFHSHESEITANSGTMWTNLTKPIMSDNHDKFKKELSEEEIKIFEIIAGDILNELDYKLVFQAMPEKEFSNAEIEEFEAENNRLKLKAIQTADQDELNRRLPQENLLKLIKTRVAVQ